MALACLAEGVEVVLADVAPVLEADAELERRLRGLDELLLLQVQDLVHEMQRRDGGLADADGGDLVGLDDTDAVAPAQHGGQGGGRHPAGGAAAHDDNGLDQGCCLHGKSLI